MVFSRRGQLDRRAAFWFSGQFSRSGLPQPCRREDRRVVNGVEEYAVKFASVGDEVLALAQWHTALTSREAGSAGKHWKNGILSRSMPSRIQSGRLHRDLNGNEH